MTRRSKTGPDGRGAEFKFLRSPALSGVLLCSARFTGSVGTPIVAQRWMFMRCDEGELDVRVVRNELCMRPRDLIAAEPGDCIAPLKRRREPTTWRAAIIDIDVVGRFLASAFPRRPPRLQRGLLSDAARDAFDALYAGVDGDAEPLAQEDLVAAFLEAAVDGGTPLPPAVLTPPIARARKYIEQHLGEEVRLADLEAEVGLSRFYLVRRFRAEIGMPPHAYQLALRLDRARALVASGMPLADVAARCGFTDQSHLTRHFRRAHGIAPGAYARSRRPTR